MKKTICFVYVFFLLLNLFLLNQRLLAKSLDDSYSFAIVPQQAASKLASQWLPLIDDLVTNTNIDLRFATEVTIDQFENGILQEKYDFIFANPIQYVKAHKFAKYTAIAKLKNQLIQGIIVVRKDSVINNLRDLNNQSMAFPSAKAFAATILVQSKLTEQGISIKPNFVVSHDSVYLSVATGLHAAGGGIQRTFASLDKTVQEQLRVLDLTEPFTPHAVAIHQRVPDHVKKTVQTALLALTNTSQQKRILKRLKISGFASATNSDWDDIREFAEQN